MSKKAFENLLSAVNKAKAVGGGSSNKDDTSWQCECDAAGNGFAIIRFLPGKTDDDVPFVKLYNHGFKSDQGKWYIENCGTTIGEQCPICDANSAIVNSHGGWKTTPERDVKIVRNRKRKLSYYSNILVISDPKNPDNEGKVFTFRYGQKIFDKIAEALQPEVIEGDDDPADPINVFDLKEGANFKLKIRRVEGYANFDKSEWAKQSEVEADLSTMSDLSAIVSKSAFKPYEELSKKFEQINGLQKAAKPETDDEDDEEFVNTLVKESKAEAKKPAKKTEEEEDDLALFRKMASEDDDIPY